MTIRFHFPRRKSECCPGSNPWSIALTRSNLMISDASIEDRVDTTILNYINSYLMLLGKLGITESDHRLIESKLEKYPKRGNELHTRTEILEARKQLQSFGLLFAIRRDDDTDVDVIPEELARVMRHILQIELRLDSYRVLMEYRPLRRKAHLTSVLERSGIEYNPAHTVERLVESVIEYVRPSRAVSSVSPRYGLNNEQLASWCRELNEPVSGTMEDRLQRVKTTLVSLMDI